MIVSPAITIPVGDEPSATVLFQEWLDRCEAAPSLDEDAQRFLSGVFQHSPFLKDCAFKEAAFLASCLTSGFDKPVKSLIETQNSAGLSTEIEVDFMRELRINKRRMALACGCADLGGWWRDSDVTKALSTFADASVSAALDFILSGLHKSGTIELVSPENPQVSCGLIVLGMGKLGAFELNYSSDIDLIIFFDEASGMRILHDDPYTLLNRMGRQLIKLLQERTPDGYVFRTDLRLRPDPSSTPLIMSVEAALNYYEGQGQNWERSAMIKARPIAGDIEAAERFLGDLAPFVWRKYLDFNAINDVQSIKRQIHAHKGHGEIAVLGHNIKLGRGGIREIEFFAQTQQLIAGGRNRDLRCRETEAALNALSEANWISKATADELVECYWYLRKVEHRLQMHRDEQTHTLPDERRELGTIAALMGEADPKAFEKQVRHTLETVERHYSALFEDAQTLSAGTGNLVFTGDEEDPETLDVLASLGFKNPQLAMKTVKVWHVAKVPALRTTTARELLTELVPNLLEAFSRTENPDAVLAAFDTFVAGLPAGIQLFSILKNNPELAVLLVRLLDTAPRLAEQISRKPHVFDLLLDSSSFDFSSSSGKEFPVLEALLRRAQSFEQFLDALRQYASEARFGIGTRLFNGDFKWRDASINYSELAEILIKACFDRVVQEFEIQHGKVSGARICVLGMGRLGSRELTATSDLDLIFLYDVPASTEASDGPRPLDPTLYHARLIQRFITAMTAPTAEGVLYPLDFRLRPSGNAGPLATTLEAFLKYQENDAWVWEAQALTRARPVYGDPGLCGEVIHGIGRVLQGVSKRHEIKPEISKMRKLIDKEKGDANPWNVKTVRGGLLDIEFLAQLMVLSDPASFDGLTSTSEILGKSVQIEQVEETSLTLAKAFDVYSEVLHLGRTCLGELENLDSFPKGFSEILCKRLDQPSLEACLAYLKSLQEETAGIFDKTLKD